MSTRHTNKNSKNQSEKVDLNVCALCLGSEDDVEKYGKFFRCSIQELAVHEYCLFFASGLAQNGEDHEGFDGFLHQDIKDEIKRASKLRCTVCHKKGAAIGCCVLKCCSAFHFVCGLQKHALFQFFDSFRAFCKRHRPTQKILPSYSEPLQTPTCPICLSDVDNSDSFTTLKSPCCKNAWFHRSCIQKQALANGMYFFRCAFCNNFDEFQEEMKQMGIYIPDRDAIWEQGDAYVELLHQHNRCDAANCICPRGRDFSGRHKNQRWRIFKCFACGQSGTHRWCQQPEISRRFFCQNCVVCFPQHEQTKNDTLTSTASENGYLDDSQSTSISSQNSETTAQELNTSTDMENAPLSQLMEHFKTKINTSYCKDDCNSSTGSETMSLSIEHVFSCVDKQDAISHLDDYTAVVSSDESNYVDIENLSTDSSGTLSIHSGLNAEDPKVKTKERKRKALVNQDKDVRQRNTSIKPRTKAQRRAKIEEGKKRAQQREKAQMEKTKKSLSEISTKSKTKKDSKKDLTKNDSDATTNDSDDSFCLFLSPESDDQKNDLKTKSPNKTEKIPLLSLEEDCSDKYTLDGLSSKTHSKKLASITSWEEKYAPDGKKPNGKTGSSLESKLQIETASISATSSPSKSSDGAEMSMGKKNNFFQRDIRSMLISPNSDSKSLTKSPIKLVGDQGCQTEPLKLRKGNKRRKLGAKLSSEYKSITTFMSVNDSSPKRKLPKGKMQCTTLNSHPVNDEMETASSTMSSSIIETMTAAKGMVMRALKRLSGSSEDIEETDASIPRKSPFRDIGSSDTESWKSGPSKVKDQVDDALTPSGAMRESVEDTDSDSSDSIKVVKVKKGRGPRHRVIPLNVKKCIVPSYIHEKFCACYNIHERKGLGRSRPIKPLDPNEVIVIDDENDDQDSGKGSSRDTSDAGTKSGDGSGSENKETPSKEDNDQDNYYYSSCEDDISFDDDDSINDRKAKLKLDSSTNDIENNQAVAKNVDRCSSYQSVSKEPNTRTRGDGRKSSKRSKTNVKEQEAYGSSFCQSGNSDELVDVSPTVLTRESLENSYNAEKLFRNHNDSNGTFEPLDDDLIDECTENDFKGDLRKKGKLHSSKKAATQGRNLSPLSQKSKSNFSSKKTKPLELGKKNFLSLQKYMECSDEDFQSKKKLTSSSKDIKSTKSTDKDLHVTKTRKKKNTSTREKLCNSSCTSTVSTVTGNAS